MASTFDFIARLIARDETKAAYAAATASVNQLSTAQQRAAKSAGTSTPTAAQIRRQQEYTAAIKERAIAEKQLASVVEASAAKTSGGSGATGLEKFAGAAGRVLGISVGAYAVRQAADWAAATTVIGASALDVENSLTRLSLSYGVNGREITRQLVAMSHGSMNEMDAMTQVNRALFAQNTELAKNLPQIFAIARSAAIKSGEDVQRTYDSLILGILRGSYRLIDNADIYLRVAEITERWAASLGTTVDEMSIQERQVAVMNAILQDGVAVANAATSSNASYAESVKAIGVAFTNLRRDLGQDFAKNLVDSGASSFITGMIEDLRENIRLGNETVLALQTARTFTGETGRSGNAFTRSPYENERADINELAAAYEELLRYRRLIGGGEETRRGGSAFPASIKEAPKVMDDAARGTENYKKNLDALSSSIALAQGYLRSSEAALKSQSLALAALQAPAIRAAAGYRELGEAILEATGAFNASQFGSTYKRAESGVSSALLGLAGIVPSEQLSQMYDEFVAKLPTVIAGLEAQGLSTFEADLEVQKLINSFDDFASKAKDSGKEAEKAMKAVQKSVEDLYGEIESVATSGLEVTPQDVLDTEAGVYQNKALEPVRRLRDIVEKGLESPYAGLFKIPPEVLEQGTDAIKAWANRLADRGAALLDINLVDKDAFLRQWDEFQADVEAKKNTLATMAGWLVSTGRVSSLGEGKATAAKMLGIEDPEGAAKSVGTGLIAGITSADITGSVINHMVTEGKKREKEYKDAGGEIGKLWASGFLDTVKTDVGKVRSILAELLVPEIIARLPQGAPP